LAKFFELPTDTSNFVNFNEIKNFLTPETYDQSLLADSAQFLTNYSHQNLLLVLKPGCSFREVVNSLTKYHRVAIGDDRIENYITQSEVVKVLKEKGAFTHLADKTIEELSLGSKNLISIKETDKVIEAFKLMVLHKVSGLGVINEKNQLVGQISSSDIKSISHSGEMLPRLYETYPTYKKILVNKYNVTEKTITVPSNSKLSIVLETIVNNRLHRVFIVGNDNHAEGVITLTDLLKLM